MKIIRIFTAGIFTLLFSTVALAGDGFTPDEAFQTMLKLEGTWIGEAAVVPVGQSREDAQVSSTSVSFKNIGNSSVMQTFAAGTPAEMVSVYHQNGKEELIHTHYCAIGNQPSMTFADSDEAGVIDFQFTSGTNMDVEVDPHAHDSYMKIIDEDTYETRTANWGGGKVTSYRYTTMKRVQD
jgi:hypothetical protein